MPKKVGIKKRAERSCKKQWLAGEWQCDLDGSFGDDQHIYYDVYRGQMPVRDNIVHFAARLRRSLHSSPST